MYENQTYLQYVGDIEDVWASYLGDGQTIAVIDSGFDVDHSEFKFADDSSKVLGTSAYFHHEGGSVTTEVGADKVKITDGDSHGTFCAAVAAASATGEGTVGIAPNANLMLLKTDKKPRSICEAFKYAADHGACAITISIGSYSDYDGDLVDDGSDLTKVFNESLGYAHGKGVVICSAAGNGGGYKPYEFTYPSASDYVIGAGGLADKSRTSIWSGSSRNSEAKYQFCDVFAPAENMFNACNYVNDQGKTVLYDGGWNGTSFASPQIAGAAALYFEKNPTATNTDFERALFHTCNDIGTNGGYGAFNIKALMNYEKPSDADITISFEAASWWMADNAETSVFAWNYALTSVTGDFPGAKMAKGNSSTWSIKIDRTLYDCLVFARVSSSNEFWGAQTIDLSMADFKDGSVYSIADTSAAWVSDSNYVTGTIK
ncbi:MAG: S8/S53 family peptidase [Bacilli bacterium]|nr:S8/S53 family peptidase [Bacilli bacterium]